MRETRTSGSMSSDWIWSDPSRGQRDLRFDGGAGAQ